MPVSDAKPHRSESIALDRLVDRFAAKMKQKLQKKRREGYTGWNDPGFVNDLARFLSEHVTTAQRDPHQWIDVANFAAMLWGIGRRVTSDVSDPKPDRIETADELERAFLTDKYVETRILTALRAREAQVRELREALEQCERTAALRALERAREVVEAKLRGWEHELEEKHILHGAPVQRVGQSVHSPLIEQSADIARVRLVVDAALIPLAAGEGKS